MQRMVRLAIAVMLLALMTPVTWAAHASGPDNSTGKIAWPAYQAEAVRLLQEYLRIDTSNPPGNEARGAEFLHRLFDAAGIANTVYTYAPGRANIYAAIKGDGSQRPLILLSHLDTVRAQPGQWKVPPFSGEIVDGQLYGRGALDMKDVGLVHAMIMLMVAREHIPLHRDLIFLATADEEVNDTGSEWMIKNHPELIKNAEYVLTEGGPAFAYPNGKALYEIGVGEKATFWLRLTARGRGGHGSVPIADSAPNRLVRAMYKVVNWEPPVQLLPFVEQYFHNIAALETGPRAASFRDIRHAVQDAEFLRLLAGDRRYGPMLRNTVSLTMMSGSEQTNTIPDTASCNLDVRLLPGATPADFMAQLRAVIGDDQIQVDPIAPIFRPPNASSTDTALYRAMEEVVHSHDPNALVTPFMNNGYTESQMYRELGIAAYGFNPFVLPQEVQATKHAANERIAVDQLQRGLQLMYEVVMRVAASSN